MSYDILLPPLYSCFQMSHPPFILITDLTHATVIMNTVCVFYSWQIICYKLDFRHTFIPVRWSARGVFIPVVGLSLTLCQSCTACNPTFKQILLTVQVVATLFRYRWNVNSVIKFVTVWRNVSLLECGAVWLGKRLLTFWRPRNPLKCQGLLAHNTVSRSSAQHHCENLKSRLVRSC
jgi:hypothetical protein